MVGFQATDSGCGCHSGASGDEEGKCLDPWTRVDNEDASQASKRTIVITSAWFTEAIREIRSNYNQGAGFLM